MSLKDGNPDQILGAITIDILGSELTVLLIRDEFESDGCETSGLCVYGASVILVRLGFYRIERLISHEVTHYLAFALYGTFTPSFSSEGLARFGESVHTISLKLTTYIEEMKTLIPDLSICRD